MKQFVIVYLGGNQLTVHEEANEYFSKYITKLSSLGESLVVPFISLKDTNTVSPGGAILMQ